MLDHGTMSEDAELAGLDAVGTAAVVASGALGPHEAVAAATARIDVFEPALGALVHRVGNPRVAAGGPLAGVTAVVKDWSCTEAGLPNWMGTRVLRDLGHRAAADHQLMTRWRAAGITNLGRSTIPEFAQGPPTTEPDAGRPTRNPWDLSRSVGGSSGGSAAAVASGMVPVAQASDGGGSLRIPAACCGLLGLKVTRGRISNHPNVDGLGHKVEGYLVRSVRDVATMLDVSAGNLPGDTWVATPPPRPYAELLAEPPSGVRLRIAVTVDPPRSVAPAGAVVAQACRTAVEQVAATLGSLRHRVTWSTPDGWTEPVDAFATYAAERTVVFDEIEALLGRRLEAADVEPRTWAMRRLAEGSSAVDFAVALRRAQRWSALVLAWWEHFDVLLTPTMGRTTPLIGELKETPEDPLRGVAGGVPMAWFTLPFNLTGQPAISLPTSTDPDGMPVGVQLVAAPFREDLLISVAAQLERAGAFEGLAVPGVTTGPGRWDRDGR